MTKALPTQILLDTSILSKIISDVLDEVGASPERKSACLNRAAARIAGTKHNWGYLTGQKERIDSLGLREDDETVIIKKADPEELAETLDKIETAMKAHLDEDKMRLQLVRNIKEAASTLVSLVMPLARQMPDFTEPLDQFFEAYCSARPPFRPGETVESLTEDMIQNHAPLIETAAIAYLKRSEEDLAILKEPAVSGFLVALRGMSSQDKLVVRAALHNSLPSL